MRNPLNKRILRDLKSDFGKYIAIFLFIVLFTGLMSGFLVTGSSVTSLYENSWVKYNIEDGHISFEAEPPEEVMKNLEKDNDLKFYKLFYKDETTEIEDGSVKLRIYEKRDSVNTECLMEGSFPKTESEIAVDRGFADNNSLNIGDKLTVDSKKYTICGLVALVDYSALFENNSDMMFDAINFGVSIVSKEGFESIDDSHLVYNYAWKYNTPYSDDTEANTRSEKLIDSLEDVIINYDEMIIQGRVDSLYDDIKSETNTLKDLFVTASETIELKITNASVSAAEKAVNSLSDEEKYAVIIEKTGLTEEEIESKLIDSVNLTTLQKAKLMGDSLTMSEEELMAEVYQMTGLTQEKIMEMVIDISGLTEEEIGEALLEKAAAKQGKTVNALVAAELGISEEKLNDLSDTFDENDSLSSDFELPDKAPVINLRDEEADFDSESLDFDFTVIYEFLDKLDETKLYDTAEIRKSISKIEGLKDSLDLKGKDLVNVSDYLPRYLNQAIIFVGTDGQGDKASAEVMTYMIFVILAFVFAVTTSNTITKEAGVIGTLRASGYSRRELLAHYIVLPIIVTLIAALIGNVLGYTVFIDTFKKVYYSNYALPIFELKYSPEAFIKTTVIPVVMMIVINLAVLIKKLRIRPLDFLRGDLSKKGKKRTVRLSPKLRFFSRFRLRILFQNIPAYFVLFAGLILGGAFLVFSMMFGPLLEDYSDLVVDSQISEYQYILTEEKETSDETAEKFCVTSLDTTVEGFLTDSVMIYGIEENSNYVKTEIPEGEVIVSNALMIKFGYEPGDEFTLKETYSNKTYKFKIAGDYTYDGAIVVFMNHGDYVKIFNEDRDFFNGYFSNNKITDIDSKSIATTITKQDMLKMVNQMSLSMLEFMNIFMYFGIAVFLLLSFLMTKQILEKNAGSISMTKILGFSDIEIGRLYLVITSFVVLASLLLACPLINGLLKVVFNTYMYTRMSGYIPFIVSKTVYVKMVVIGMLSYIVIAALMLLKIKKVPKGTILKNQMI